MPEARIDPTAVILSGAHIHGQVEIGPRALVMFGAVVRAELDRIVIGAETNIQDNAVLHCDEDIPTLVGERVTVGHSAVVHGCKVGDKALIGMGAMALNGSVMGEGSWLGAGSVLTEGKKLPAWTLALGTPARPVRYLTPEEIKHADQGVDHYLELAQVYREMLGPIE